MIKVLVGNNLNTTEVLVEDTTPIRTVMSSYGISTNATVHINGQVVTDINKTFRDYGCVAGQTEERHSLIVVAKTDNALA